jgi:hypothetical protein
MPIFVLLFPRMATGIALMRFFYDRNTPACFHQHGIHPQKATSAKTIAAKGAAF